MKKRLFPLTCVACLLLVAAPAFAQSPTVTSTYAAKFICGIQKDTNINSPVDAEAGRYATKINVYNNTGVVVTFRKRIIQLRRGESATDPAAKIEEALKPGQAMEVTCFDIYKLLNIPVGQTQPPYIEGFVILEVANLAITGNQIPPDPLDVEGIYTYKGDLPPTPTTAANGSGVSISVVVFPVKNNKHVMQ